MHSKIITPRLLFISTAILLAAVSRLFPHIPNFTPIGAMALFGAVYFENKLLAFGIPLAAMFLSDIGLELTTGWGFHNTIGYVYVGFILTSCVGLLVKRDTNVISIIAGSVISSILFFIITNFGVWASGPNAFAGGAAGLSTTYILGIPYFTPTLFGDIFFNAILFGSFYFAQRKYPVLIRVKA